MDDKHSVNNIRRNMVSVAKNCKGKIHWGSSLSCVEIFYVLYAKATNLTDKNIVDKNRDQIIISKGQAALALYATMFEVGLIDDAFIEKFQGNGSNYPEEIMENKEMQIPCSTGSLGLGMPYAVGVALGKKRKNENGKIYVVVGDGECDEGSIWEAAMLASHYKLDNLVLIVDYNGLQADGAINDVMNMNDIGEKFDAFGWSVVRANGHDCDELEVALMDSQDKPKVIIATTIKGKGISFMENEYMWHDRVLDKELFQTACKEVNL